MVFKIKCLKRFHRTFFPLLMVFCLGLGGCSSKKTVTYIPHEKHISQEKRKRLILPQVQYDDRIETLKKYYTSWKGTRYRRGGLSRKGVDCSGFTVLAYKELFGKRLPRTVREQVRKGMAVQKASLQPGDLVFFKTGRIQKHVGIYLDNDRFMHASRSRGVMISRLDDTYWQKRYWQAKRI